MAIAIFLLATHPSMAIPASPLPFETEQLDGTRITLRIMGDEYFHWYEDLNGFTVVRNKAGDYVYAALGAKGELASTRLLVAKDDPASAGLSRRILPTPEIRRRLRAESLPGPMNTGSPPGPPTGVPPTGTVKNLVVLCKFSDHTLGVHTRPQGDYDILWNAIGGDPVLAPTGSVRDVFTENSYGVLTLNSTVVAWVTLPQTEAYYANGSSGLGGFYPENPQGMVEDALNLVDPLVDFGQFDLDSDGFIDAISIIHSGFGAETGGGGGFWIWSHKWSLWQLPGGLWTSADANGLGENVKVFDYHTEPALWGTSGTVISRIGVAAHETGHFFGLPDLYDVDGGGEGIGSYGMMANSWGFNGDQLNPPHFSAWSKIFLGWATPTIITSPGAYTIPDVETTPFVYRIDAGYSADEYLLVENRQPIGFDSTLPQGGLAIWHIDDNKGSISFNDVNTDEGYPGQGGWPGNNNHYRVALLQADGIYDLEHGNNRGDGGDVYHATGVSSIDSNTVPNTDTYQGGIVTVSGNAIRSISASGVSMSFSYGRDCNGNGIFDACDIDCGAPGGPCDVPGCGGSLDCNNNLVPDECEADCNNNGFPDECDISGLTSEDCNANGIPDECDILSLGSALDFDGADDWVRVLRSPSLEPTDELTLETWVNADSIGTGNNSRIVRIAASFGAGYILSWSQSGNQRLQLRIDGTVGGNALATDPLPTSTYFGQWIHVAGVYSATLNICQLYVNGVLVDNQPAAGLMQYSGSDLYLGNHIETSEDFDGRIDEVRIWNVARSQQQIIDNMDRPLLGSETGLVGYWRFNEGLGQFALDSSPQGNHGFLGDNVNPAGDARDPLWVTPGAPINESDCNGNGLFDACDILGGTSTDCNGNGMPDECEPGGTEDCNANMVSDLCDIFTGTSQDCNANSIPDDCELTGNDCNANGVPDDCEPDCNGNGVADECDIANGTSQDVNMTGIPDECEFFLVTDRVKPCGRLYLTPSGATDSLRVFDRSGNPVTVLQQGLVLPAGGTLSTDVDGNLLVSQWDADHVKVISPSGALVRTINAGGLNGPNGATMTPAQGIAICSYLTDSIKFYQADGTFLSNLSANVQDPQCLAYDRDGNLYVGNRNNGNGNIAVFNDQMQFVMNMGQGLFSPHPLDMAFDANEVLYVTTPGAIHKFDKSGTFLGSLLETGLDPRGIAIDENGVRWVTNGMAMNIFRFDSSDQLMDTIGVDFGANPPSGLILYGIAFDVGSETDCNNNAQPDACEIDAGTAQDCNFNGLPDSCDLAGNDCNGNGIPDECEPDCNGNLIADACDISQCPPGDLTCADCNMNGVLDGCEIDLNSGALDFDGVDDWVNIPLNVSEIAYTASLWFKTTCLDCGIYGIKAGPPGTPDTDRIIYLDNGELLGYIWNTETIRASGVNVSDGNWHHVTHVFGGSVGGQRLYVDGILRASGNKASSNFTWQTNVTLGYGVLAVSDYFNGQLGEVRIWSDALSPAEIMENYQGFSIPNLPNLMGHWSFGESVGDQQVIDLSGSGHHGTLGGSAAVEDADPGRLPNETVAGLGGDCNGNGFLDECDIASMASQDCNANGIPDECEPNADCNTNGIQDICDIFSGTSQDCDNDSVPDECELVGNDCNSNTIPDNCEPGGLDDCNLNGQPDLCDLFNGTGLDCNANGVLDECDISSGTSTDINMNNVPDDCEIDVHVMPVVTILDPALTTEVRTALPGSVTSITEGSRYYVEIWASDAGDLNTGLSAVYVDVSFCTTHAASNLFYGSIFNFLPLGSIQSGGVDEFGGATFQTDAGVDPEWVRIGWIEMIPGAGVSPCTISLAQSFNGVVASGRGTIPWAFIELGSLDLQIDPPAVSYDLDADNFIGFGDFVLLSTSWLQTVPPADPAHDFDCDMNVGPGDLSWFATGWQKTVGDPTILYPPCPPQGGTSGQTDIDIRVIPVSAPSAVPITATLPTLVQSVPLGGIYYAEIWASDVGDINSGLTSGYVNLGFPSPVASVQSLTNNLVWTVLHSGSQNIDMIEELGGSDLPGGMGASPDWILVGRIQLHANGSAPSAILELLPSMTGVAALARGVIPWSDIALSSATIIQGTPGDIDSDGDVDPFDVETFVAVLIGTDLNSAHRIASDFNGDGEANGRDVQLFVEAIVQP